MMIFEPCPQAPNYPFDPFEVLPPIWGDDLEPPDDYEPEPYLIDMDVMLVTSDPTAIEPQYATVPGIMTATGPKEWR